MWPENILVRKVPKSLTSKLIIISKKLSKILYYTTIRLKYTPSTPIYISIISTTRGSSLNLFRFIHLCRHSPPLNSSASPYQ